MIGLSLDVVPFNPGDIFFKSKQNSCALQEE